jgi:uncharacterized protein
MILRPIIKLLKSHKKDLIDLGVRSLSIFGSVARNESTKKSDIDILVDFDPKKGFFAFAGLQDYLESILNCRVDLVTKNALHPALKAQILQEAKNVF